MMRRVLSSYLQTSNARVSGDVVLEPPRAATHRPAPRHQSLLGGGREAVQVGDE